MTPTPVRIILYVLCGFIVLLLAFEAGIFAGSHNIGLGYDRDDRGFLPPPGVPHILIKGGYGSVGVITQIGTSTLTLQFRDGDDTRVVDLSTSTVVGTDQGFASTSVLMKGESVAVIGSPQNDGSLRAKFIRVLPSPSGQATSSAQ